VGGTVGDHKIPIASVRTHEQSTHCHHMRVNFHLHDEPAELPLVKINICMFKGPWIRLNGVKFGSLTVADDNMPRERLNKKNEASKEDASHLKAWLRRRLGGSQGCLRPDPHQLLLLLARNNS
jgi:hypothetical protein